MKYETSVVYLEQIPKVVVDTGFDWSNLWTFLGTICIFMLGTYLTIRNFNKTVQSQEKVAAQNFTLQRDAVATQERIANQNSLKASRQDWINDLRNTCAAYIAEALNVQRLNIYWESAQPKYRLYSRTEPSIAHQMHADWAASHVQAMKDLISLKSKIELLINPDETDSKELMKAVIELYFECDRAAGSAKKLAESVVYWCQHILKQEWEKAKAGK
ncbi:hypothetical protein [Pseudomonas graminis]|uniref:DUF4760 domain-containing protein n=1 Tax=Pseudomonas graminis TaxID=158627 RepID=A0A6M8MDF5_9PSED|nr:hypothetical protein [Pseudomonas graminis]QKF52779.1 hypothetical protein FX982_03771 [Pseudomonas graminis]